MRVLAAVSLGGAGHLNPLVPFLQAVERRGDEVLVVGPSAMGEHVAATGLPFAAGGEPDEVEVAPIRERLPSAPAAEASVGVHRRRRSSSRGTRHGLTDVERATSYLTRLPVELDPSPFRRTIRFRHNQPAAQALADWWGGDRSPLVYMTFGTVLGHMSIAAGVYRAALRAVEGLGLRVLLTVGRRFDPAVLGPLPAGLHAERWVDQEQVLPAADVVVCHGGSGTVYGAVAAGVRVVVVPVFADQFENGRRVAAAGAGVVVEVDGGSRARVVDERDTPRIRSATPGMLDHWAVTGRLTSSASWSRTATMARWFARATRTVVKTRRSR